MKIDVQNKDLGFFTQSLITAQRREDGEVVWCNHHGAVQETVENQIDRIDEPDITWKSSVLICDKCSAYKLEGDDWWQEAPFEGITYESR